MRGDLDMPPGKLASQAGHAYLDAAFAALDSDPDPDIVRQYRGDRHGTKVCLKAKNLHAIMRARDEAVRLGLPFALVEDQGHVMPPHFDGSPIVTAIGIGPCLRRDIHAITKRFRSM